MFIVSTENKTPDEDCADECKKNEHCNYFTHRSTDKLCVLKVR